jgi:hypothetical protein
VKLLAGIALTLLALVIGVAGIIVLFVVGESYNYGLLAYLAVSLLFALLAGLLSFVLPEARWAIAIAMCAPVVILSVMGASMGWFYLPGAIWTATCTAGGAYLGAKLRRPAAHPPEFGAP